MNNEARIGDWMQTYIGVQFWPLDPRPVDINLFDIAHALSNQCRFAGHVTEFYSVAQHSVLVAGIVPSEHAAWALLHDAAEAYLVDLPRPIKRYSTIGTEYREVESRLMAAICKRFGLPVEEPAEVKAADDIALMTEKRDLMPNCPAKWREDVEPLLERIQCWGPSRSEAMFLARARELGLNL